MRDNTDFWCCDDLIEDLKEGGWTLQETIQMYPKLRYCPYCGKKLSILA